MQLFYQMMVNQPTTYQSLQVPNDDQLLAHPEEQGAVTVGCYNDFQGTLNQLITWRIATDFATPLTSPANIKNRTHSSG